MTTHILSVLFWFSGLILAPLLIGVVNRTKAFFGGRKGQSFFQLYYDLHKLIQKGSVYSQTSTWIFQLSPPLGLAALMISLFFVPAAGLSSPFSFTCDFIFIVYALGLIRFFTVLSAMDTGSAFEGMGASRAVQFALIAEAALLSGLAVLAIITGKFTLSEIYEVLWTPGLDHAGASLLLVAGMLLLVMLAENARIPVDDPTTHLELTMIHEVMVLDHSGIDLAFIEYSAALKLWLFAALMAGLTMPLRTGQQAIDMAVTITGVFLVAIILGIIESTMARLRMLRVPQMLVLSLAFSLAAFLWTLR